MISARTRQARSRLANAIRLGHTDVDDLRIAYDVERARDAILAVRGATSAAQRECLRDAADATAGGEQA